MPNMNMLWESIHVLTGQQVSRLMMLTGQQLSRLMMQRERACTLSAASAAARPEIAHLERGKSPFFKPRQELGDVTVVALTV